jgi:hypothetical protein
MTGLWSISKDDIKLQIQNNKYRVDSLQREKGHLLTPTIIYFQIRDRQLFREWKFQDRTMTIELLTKR